MKLQKNKIVFALVLVGVVLFITVYAILTFGKDKKETLEPNRIPTPDVEENPVEYGSKLEAIEAIKEEREVLAPQLYPDHMVDDKGYFNPDYMEYEKQRIIDSIYRDSKFKPDAVTLLDAVENPKAIALKEEGHREEMVQDTMVVSLQERALSHQLFFASDPKMDHASLIGGNGIGILAYVDGDQVLRDGHRLDLRLGQDFEYHGVTVPEDTRIYGFVKLRPNRVLVNLARFGDLELSLRAHDLQDGQEGIYVENHMKEELMERGLDETLGEVNVPGLPQIGGFKRIFQRHNRAIKVDVKDNYQLLLKQEL
ncbi:MAG: conjugal transfer protein TraM [Muricauda sp.]|nr:conjugative transposon protein TraM [uncultured Allomuricauda sp.]MAO16794.1 conjugal transfer protein TraM [Allomuricauda sp.]MBC73997.1 conjugal transfer protein TraM [Allomuricauda sp.]|tara:strand:- start:5162 stop:6094 length:933 start_codon:yes stop_codon:yes gene_type:complete